MFKGAHARSSLKKRKEGKEKEKGILCTIQRHCAVPFIVIFFRNLAPILYIVNIVTKGEKTIGY